MNFFSHYCWRVTARAGWRSACLAVGGLLMALPAMSQWKDWDYALDEEKKPWSELQVQIPAYPKTDTLMKFDSGAATSNTFFVDAASISVGEDGVVRYTLLVKTGGGATNVSFEGIRCETREHRIYAFGRPNAEWSRARESKWRFIEFREINNHHLALHREYFCIDRKRAAPLKQILNTLRYGPARRPDGG